MSDHRISLDGKWAFQVSSDDFETVSASERWKTAVSTDLMQAVVPMPWQAQFQELRLTGGVAWYRRTFTVEQAALKSVTDSAAILHFGAVDYYAAVWVNGEKAGEHEGGYLPFEFDIINLLKTGENELLVRVVDATDDRQRYPSFPFSEVPHGKQSWYGPVGGIWQSVWLEFRSKLHISSLTLLPQPEQGAIDVQVDLSQEPADDYQVVCTVTDPNGEIAASTVFEQTTSGTIQLDSVLQLWSPDTPSLYTLQVAIQVQNAVLHTMQKACGFRVVNIKNGRVFLNGQPIYLRGVLDQAYYPETIYTPPSLELLEAQAKEIKRLGFNCLRTHIKIEDPRYYDVADRLGLLVWTEIPNWAYLTGAASKRAKKTFAEMVKRDNHHPSIIAWTLINENWGTDLTRNAEHRRWLADFYQEAKAIDPTRIIVDNSACVGNAHVAGDVEDYHYYRAIPDHAREWDEWVADFAGRSDWAWYADFEQNRRDDLPLLVSEFGNWGLPDPETIQEQGQEPWWFETGHEWGDGIVYPHGVLERYQACGLADLFSSFAEFARHSQEHMARSLHYEITTMRLHEPIAGYVITEFADVHWECNGLLTMQRATKYLLDPLLKDLNQDRVVLLRPEQWNGRSGQTLQITVQTMGIVAPESAGVIKWQAGKASGEIPAPGGDISVLLDKPGVITLTAQWLAADSTQLAANQVDLVCIELPPTETILRIASNPTLTSTLHNLGYMVREGDADETALSAEIVVATQYTRSLEAYIQQGGRVLLLADPNAASTDSTVSLPVGQIVPRENTPWQGDWANSFAWMKKQGAFAHLPGSPFLEMESAAIMPDAVIAGLPSWIQQDHSWAGLAVGWVHKAVSLLVVLPYGKGQIVMTTFKINAATLANDAVAQALLAGMVNML